MSAEEVHNEPINGEKSLNDISCRIANGDSVYSRFESCGAVLSSNPNFDCKRILLPKETQSR